MAGTAQPEEYQVIARRAPFAHYANLDEPLPAPELPGGTVRTVAGAVVRELLRDWGLDPGRYGQTDWNPLGAWIAPGMSVTLKPNWVRHNNYSGQGLECLVTHVSVIEAVLAYVALAHPSRVVVGDAPLQGCNFSELSRLCDLDEMAQRFRKLGFVLDIVDFRRTVLHGSKSGAPRDENRRDMESFVLYDLAGESLLETISGDSRKFRVTMYNPDLMQRTHAPGRHQYLVAREVIDADVVINLPKLKTHKKAGMTGALKNLIGINGNKEYLPHHRKGCPQTGGDCYESDSVLKRAAETLMDSAFRRKDGAAQSLLANSAELLLRGAVRLGSDNNMEGSWYGNDTIWRTCLDLQRILRYGDLHGKLRDVPQRTVLSITDAIIGGEGEGPLASTPIGSGFMTASSNPAAAEWVNTRLMGFDPERIPLVRGAFAPFSHPIAAFSPSGIAVCLDGASVSMDQISAFPGKAFLPSSHWAGHCELRGLDDSRYPEQTVVA